MDQKQKVRIIRDQMWKEIDYIIQKTEEKLWRLQNENKSQRSY